MLKNVISFSLWGDNPKYLIGAVRNAELAKKIYPGWECRFYVDRISIQDKNIQNLTLLSNTKIISYDIIGDWTFNILRFLPMCEDIDYMISRDCDSRLSEREKLAVDQWIFSNKKFHIMKDHPFQFNFPILAGMFGSKKILNDTNIFNNVKNYGHFSDQIFLQKYIFPLINNDCLIHDSIKNTGIDFPSKRLNNEFIGDVYDENDNRHQEYWKFI